ncbi:MAG: hypothetical protein SGPRY_010386 [Prymnesium sp.]
MGERFEEAAARKAKEKPCDWCRKPSVIECTLCGLKNVHHFCQNEMVPILAVDMALRLCIECAQKETPGICEELDAAQVDKLLEDNNVKRKFRTLAEKKKYLLSLCK